AIESILAAREARGGSVRTLGELCEHLDLRLVNKRVLESLVKAGALDSLAPAVPDGFVAPPLRVTRPRLMAALDLAVEHGARVQRDKELGQADLFGNDGSDAAAGDMPILLPEAPSWTEMELLNFEKEALGLFWSGHPVDAHIADLQEVGARTIG